jgi:hypothetical protein
MGRLRPHQGRPPPLARGRQSCRDNTYRACPRRCWACLARHRTAPFENQRFPDELHPAVAAIILQNTVYLSQGVAGRRANGETRPDQHVVHIAPLGGEHIRFNSDYIRPTWPTDVFGLTKNTCFSSLHP